MNSSFTLSDVGAFSPLDYSQVSFLRTPLTGAARNSRGAEQWKIFVEPNVSMATSLGHIDVWLIEKIVQKGNMVPKRSNIIIKDYLPFPL